MNGRNSAAAALPIMIAMMGSALPTGNDDSGMRVRMAVNAPVQQINFESLNDDQMSWIDEHNPYGVPQADQPGNRTLIVRPGYTLAHNNVDLIADWVSYHLTAEYADGPEDRPGSGAFKPEPLLKGNRRAELADYKGWSGVYDRGHQVAAGDSKGRGKRVINDSFYLSNMTPQSSRLNQTRWRLLEMHIQRLAKARQELWVITGPVFKDENQDGMVEYFVIGENQVSVPTHYFKIVVAHVPGDDESLEAMAFLIPNEAIDNYADYLSSIDEIEDLTGYDFLEALDDAKEESLEATIASTVWTLDSE